MNQKRKYKTYSKEFKEEAVSLVNDQGYSVSEAAEAVGVNPNQVYNWKNQQEEQVKGSLLNDNERTELIKLRAENKREQFRPSFFVASSRLPQTLASRLTPFILRVLFHFFWEALNQPLIRVTPPLKHHLE